MTKPNTQSFYPAQVDANNGLGSFHLLKPKIEEPRGKLRGIFDHKDLLSDF